jgi:Abortive infection C-terminus
VLAGRKQQQAKRPHIYGDERKARATLARQIARGEELLNRAGGVQKRIDQAKARAKTRTTSSPRPKSRPRTTESSFGIQFVLRPLTPVEVGEHIAGDWISDVRTWSKRTRRAMRDYLEDQFIDVLPTLAEGLPYKTTTLDGGTTWLRKAIDELLQMQAALGVQRAIAPSPPAPTRFAELLASGLVDARIVNDHAKSMKTPLRTPKQLSDAIGAAKELTEATLRGALDQLDKPPRSRDDLPTLMKAWREAIGQAAPSRGGADVLARALNTQVAFLAEWRNRYGRGHGRTRYPAGVKTRHARLAVDTAETCIRFIVTTMDDLQLLPP